MKTIAFILLANVVALLLVVVLAARGLLPLAPEALDAKRSAADGSSVFGDVRSVSPARGQATNRRDGAALQTALVTFANRWTAPLLDRLLTPAERTESLSPDLQDAILRMEPIYDPTRLDGPLAPQMHVTTGTASLFDVFGERWRLASDDPNVNLTSAKVSLAWQPAAERPCPAYTRRRAHDFGEASLTAMAAGDCARLLRWRHDEAAAIPVVAAPLDLPLFAAPLPGARMSSEAFWAAQQSRIASIKAHLHRKWETYPRTPVQVGSNR